MKRRIKTLSVAETETTVTVETETQLYAKTSKQDDEITVSEISSGDAETVFETQDDETVPQLIAAPEDKAEESTLNAQNETDEKSFPVVPVVAGIVVAAAVVIIALIMKNKKR